jgi:FkbM family methyltransferase
MAVRKICTDFLGLMRVCGLAIAVQWIFALAFRVMTILKTRNLQVVDRALGAGPFAIKYPTATSRFVVFGEGVLSGVREMYVRDCYLRGGILAIRNGDNVVDLGANIGNFTNLALAHGDAVKVVAVEPNIAFNNMFEESVGRNHGFRSRVSLIRGFLGEPCEHQRKLMRENGNYRSAEWLSVACFLEKAGIDRIDFLKCDIEGGEFASLGVGSQLIDMAQALAIEIHAFAGDVDAMVVSLRDRGLIPRHRIDYPDGSCILLASRQMAEGH